MNPKFLCSPLHQSSLLLTGLKLCWDLNLSFYSVQMNFNSPSPFLFSFLFRERAHMRFFIFHGSHGPGIFLEKLLGWNDFLLENPLNLKKQCLNFMKKSLNTWEYSKISSFGRKKIEEIALTSKISWETYLSSQKWRNFLQQENSVFLIQII